MLSWDCTRQIYFIAAMPDKVAFQEFENIWKSHTSMKSFHFESLCGYPHLLQMRWKLIDTTSTNFMLMPWGMRSRSGFDLSSFQHGMQAVVTHKPCSEAALGTAGPSHAQNKEWELRAHPAAAAAPLSPAQHHCSQSLSSPGHCLLQTARRDYLQCWCEIDNDSRDRRAELPLALCSVCWGLCPRAASACAQDTKAQWQSPGAAPGIVQSDAPLTPPQCCQASARPHKLWAPMAKQQGLSTAFSVPELNTWGEHRARLSQSRLPFA